MSIRTVTGRVLRTTDESPLRDALIQVWDRDFGLDDLLGTGTTADDGTFSIDYNTDDAGDTPDLTIKVLRLNADGEREVIEHIDGPKNIDKDYDFGIIDIAGWEYDPKFSVPLVLSDGSGLTSSPQNFELPQSAKILLNGAKLGIKREIGGRKSSIAGAQEVFPKSRTQRMEESEIGSSRSDAFLIDSLLNGFNPAKLSYKSSDQTYHVRYNIDDYEVDQVHQSPSVHMTLEKNANGSLCIKSISYRVRDTGANPPKYGPETTVTPNDDPARWDTAKEYYRIAEFIDGQVKGHLGRSHLNVGQYSIALYRNIQKSPIFQLLHPHLKGVSAINTFGKEVIFGATGILVVSPLTLESLVTCMHDDLGDCDWKNWSPRTEVSDQHSYARVQNTYWNVVKEHVNTYFEIHEAKIAKDWKEIYYFSKDLVEHSVAYAPTPLADGEEWFDTNEVSDSRGSNQKSASAITNALSNPPSEDVENLKQACCYAIYHATIWHDWRNDNQKNYGGEVDYARFAIDYEVEEAAFQLFIVNLLVDVKYGYLSKNEDEDIPRNFVHLLKKALPEFEKEGYDLRDLRSRINI
ncbi:MAG: hypothetical protein COB04_04955 [Gammaproteobacteria bacterium]|nr:MAG: hypothetical protein COB04_04955 [Gammaproteobacteria bacterium]